MHPSLTIALRIFKQLIKDRRTLAMIFAVPILITLMFGYALQGEAKNNPIFVISEDQGYSGMNFADDLVGFLKSDDRLDVSESSSFEDAKDDVGTARGKHGIVSFNENFTRDIIIGQHAQIHLYTDEAERAVRVAILAAVAAALEKLVDTIPGQIEMPIEIEEELAFGHDDLEGLDFTLPGVLGFVSLFLVLLISLLVLVREDIVGTKLRLLTAPVTQAELLLGYVIGLVGVALGICASVTLVGIFVFGATVHGSYLLMIVILIMNAVGTVLMATFLARAARNELQAIQFAPLIGLPSLVLSGFMVPVDTLPAWMKPLSNGIPLTYSIRALKTIMLRGEGFSAIAYDFWALVIFAAVMFVLSLAVTRKTVA